MDIRERLKQIQQVHAQHVQLLQQTQANILKLEGALEMLNEVVTMEDAAALAPEPSNVIPLNRKARRTRRTKAQMAESKAIDANLSAGETPPAQPA